MLLLINSLDLILKILSKLTMEKLVDGTFVLF